MSNQCPECGSEYDRLAQHWTMGSCEYPEISQRKKEILKGMLLGDGCIGNHREDRPYFVVGMANERFLKWLSNELGWLSYSVKQSKDAATSAENTRVTMGYESVDEKMYSDIYRLQTPRHPWFNELGSWYDLGKKVFPDDLELTPLLTKMWYVSDGGLRQREPNPHAHITSVNEDRRGGYLLSLFEEQGFNPWFDGQSIVFSVSDSKQFLEWIGDPVPGFNYKWDDINIGGDTPWRDKEKLEKYYVEQGMSLSEVGEKLGCSADTVSTWLREHDLPVRTKGGKLST